MRILAVGGGGREHALLWALKRDGTAKTLFAAPGNPGTALLGTNLPIPATNLDALVAATKDHKIDLVIVGPEAPLAAGLADRLRRTGRAVFGPNARAARIEASKAYSKDLMVRAGVPTAKSGTFTSLEPALKYIEAGREPVVVKASGLAGGKGAIVCASKDDAAQAAQALLEGGALGDAGKEIVVEEFLEGEELSVLALTDGERVVILPPAQDHKRVREGDEGPNTGGMGAYAPVGLTSAALLTRVRKEVIEPTLKELANDGAPYSGVLYAGLMVAADGTPNVIEFNCRFGDPETQAVFPVLPKGTTAHLAAIASGKWKPDRDVIEPMAAAVTTVLAAPGYPESARLGETITLPREWPDDQILFHAGTSQEQDGTLKVSGGRVLNVTGVGRTIAEAAEKSRAAAGKVSFAGMHWRRDIAWREIARAGAS
ncbi:MAG TPA: phosphoribosylamine--glycine ligase [Gemmatimonadales bacterium]|nr:phosphoribosylamine--glycine ligase [Gemmatimonadales bacterium]